MYFEDKIRKRQEKIRRNYDIADNLYDKMLEVSEIYEITVPEFLNLCIEELIKSNKITLYEERDNTQYTRRSFLVWKDNVLGLEKLSVKYRLSLKNLVNLAIHNAFSER